MANGSGRRAPTFAEASAGKAGRRAQGTGDLAPLPGGAGGGL